jgi:protein-S-isoprenylcysteine O-methyltransferase Ste14
MFALVGAGAVVSGRKLGQYPLFGFTIVLLFVLGRVMLVLPFCSQPRFDSGDWHRIIGGIIFIVGLIFCIPGLYIKAFTAPDENVKLRTTGFYGIVRNPIYTGFYGIVRNPIYLGEVLWCLGWAIIFRSIIGILLVPLWWTGLLLHTMIEEESLERELGQPYVAYKKQVRGRIIPGLPI